jgi:hypothetical protein
MKFAVVAYLGRCNIIRDMTLAVAGKLFNEIHNIVFFTDLFFKRRYPNSLPFIFQL